MSFRINQPSRKKSGKQGRKKLHKSQQRRIFRKRRGRPLVNLWPSDLVYKAPQD